MGWYSGSGRVSCSSSPAQSHGVPRVQQYPYEYCEHWPAAWIPLSQSQGLPTWQQYAQAVEPQFPSLPLNSRSIAARSAGSMGWYSGSGRVSCSSSPAQSHGVPRVQQYPYEYCEHWPAALIPLLQSQGLPTSQQNARAVEPQFSSLVLNICSS